MRKLISRLLLNSSINEIVGGASTAFTIKIFSIISHFVFNIILARLLGPNDAGLFYLALSCASICIVLGQFGINTAIVRFVASSASLAEWGQVKGVVRNGVLFGFLFSVIMALLLARNSTWLAIRVFHKEELVIPLKLMAMAVPAGTLLVLYASSLQGLCNIRDSLVVSNVLVPTLSCGFFFLLIPLYGIEGSILSYCLSAWLTLGTGYLLLKRATPHLKKYISDFSPKLLLLTSFPLFWVSVSMLIITWFPTMLLGMWENSDDVALFSIANRVSLLVGFILVCVNTISAPKFAVNYKKGNLKKLESIALASCALATCMSAPIVLVLLFFPDVVLSLFGKSFIAAQQLLMILTIGQFINVSTGSVGYLLTMSGHEKTMRNIMIASSLLLFALCLILIPTMGSLGAAIATAVTISLQNIITMVWVWKKLGIVSVPFSSIFFRRKYGC